MFPEEDSKTEQRKWRAEEIVTNAMKQSPNYKAAITDIMKELENAEGKAEQILFDRANKYMGSH